MIIIQDSQIDFEWIGATPATAQQKKKKRCKLSQTWLSEEACENLWRALYEQ